MTGIDSAFRTDSIGKMSEQVTKHVDFKIGEGLKEAVARLVKLRQHLRENKDRLEKFNIQISGVSSTPKKEVDGRIGTAVTPNMSALFQELEEMSREISELASQIELL